MKVHELIEKLKAFDGDLDVVCYSEEEDLVAPKHGLRILEINSVSAVDAEKHRGDDQIPTFKFQRSKLSEKHVLIEVTADF